MAKKTETKIETPKVETVIAEASVAKSAKMPKRLIADFSAIREVFKECGIKQDENGKIISVPKDLNILPALMKHSKIGGKNAQELKDSNPLEAVRIESVVKNGFSDLLKVAKFRHSTVKTDEVRKALVSAIESLNEVQEKKLIASCRNMLAYLPASETVSGKNVLSRKETSEMRGMVSASALAKINFPTNDMPFYDAADYGIEFDSVVDKIQKVDPIELL